MRFDGMFVRLGMHQGERLSRSVWLWSDKSNDGAIVLEKGCLFGVWWMWQHFMDDLEISIYVRVQFHLWGNNIFERFFRVCNNSVLIFPDLMPSEEYATFSQQCVLWPNELTRKCTYFHSQFMHLPRISLCVSVWSTLHEYGINVFWVAWDVQTFPRIMFRTWWHNENNELRSEKQPRNDCQC